jgi:hypothetical protein
MKDNTNESGIQKNLQERVNILRSIAKKYKTQ